MRFRPIREEDLPALRALTPNPPSPGAVRYFARTGHSFLAEEGEEARGFILAQAVWQGEGVMLWVSRLEAQDEATLKGLLRALLKSGKDTGVHRVALGLDPEDGRLKALLEEEGFGFRLLAQKTLRPDPLG